MAGNGSERQAGAFGRPGKEHTGMALRQLRLVLFVTTNLTNWQDTQSPSIVDRSP
jgi:hypothetical protein